MLILAVAVAGSANARSAATVERGGSATVACSDPEVSSLDPAKNNLGICTKTAMIAMYDTLVRLDGKGNTQPALAEKWTVANGGKQYTFTLRDDAVFHDGSPVNAEAVKFSILRMLEPTSLGSSALIRGVIRRVVAVNPRVVRVTLFSPNVAMMFSLGSPSVAPIVNPAVAKAKGGDLSTTDAGSGPFVLSGYTFGPNGKVTFTRFGKYWEMGKDGKRLPYLDSYTLVPLSDDNTRILNLRSKDVDVAQRIPTQGIKTVRDAGAYLLPSRAGGLTTNMGVNPNVAPFTNKLVREAVVEGIDRAGILKTIGFGSGYLRPTPFAADSIWDITKPDFKYDPEDAKRKLAQAGLANGFSTTISIINRAPDVQIAQLMKEQLSKIGVNLDIQVLDRATWITVNNRQQSPMLLTRSAQYLEPEVYVANQWNPENPNNFIGWKDAQAKQAYELTRQAVKERNYEKRRALYEQAVAIVVGSHTWVSMGQLPAPDATLATLKGARTYTNNEIVMTSAWTQR
jgi:peptide/nickel transport system substrate-binding protein